MADKILPSRIIHKHDIEENWLKAVNFIPKQGELIVYDIDATYNYERFKIGDGVTLVSDLPFSDDHLMDLIQVSDEVAQSYLASENKIGLMVENAISGLNVDNWEIVPVTLGCASNGEILVCASANNGISFTSDLRTWNTYPDAAAPVDLTETPTTDISWEHVVYGNGIFLVFASHGNKYLYSTNGTTWTQRTLSAYGDWSACTYGNGKFVIAKNGSDVVFYSTDGLNWTQSTSSSSSSWKSMAYGNGKYVMVTQSGIVAYSSDAITWEQTTLENRQFGKIVFGNGVFVAGTNASSAVYSTDGITWTEVALPCESMYSWATAFNDSMFLLCGYGSKYVACSSDGMNWKTYELDRVIYPECATNIGDRFFFGGYNSTYPAAFVSVDGIFAKHIHDHNDLYYTEDEIDDIISSITSGSIAVEKANEATHADSANSADSATRDDKGNVIADTYATIKAVEEFANISVADWNQNDETALDYVKNRTHWEENNTTTLEWDGDWQKDGLVTVTLDFGSPYYNYVKVSDLTPSFEELYESGELVIHFDVGDEESSQTFASYVGDYVGEDLIQQDTGWSTGFIVVAYVDGCTFSVNDVTLALPEAGIYLCHFVSGSGSFYISSLSWDTETIHTIDPKYLPDNIQSDWNQNDPEALDYVKNRPFYEAVDIVTLHEGTYTIDEDGGYKQLDGFEYTFEVGATYYVTLNGVEYECVAWTEDGSPICIGNGDIYGGEGMGGDEPFSIDSYADGSPYLNVATAGTYTLSISGKDIAVQTVPDKYIADNISRVGHIHTPEENKSTYILLEDVVNGYTYTVFMQNGNLASLPQCVGIKVTIPPANTEYDAFDYFDPTGMVVVAEYSDGSTKLLDNNLFSGIRADGNGCITLKYSDDVKVVHTVTHKGSSWHLVDFDYTYNGDGTYTITSWKETLHGVPSTELIIPDGSYIILELELDEEDGGGGL